MDTTNWCALKSRKAKAIGTRSDLDLNIKALETFKTGTICSQSLF